MVSQEKFAALCLLILLVVGCGGGSAGGGTTGGSTGGGTGQFLQVAIPSTVPFHSSVNNSPSGLYVATTSDSSTGTTVYTPKMGTSPTSAPVSMPVPAGATDGAQVYSVNDAGNAVGQRGFSGVGLYWESATSAPVVLTSPAGGGNYPPQSINASKQIVARTALSFDNPLWYYSSPTATPVQVCPDARSAKIADNGAIVVLRSSVTEPVRIFFAPSFTAIQPTVPAGYTKFRINGSDFEKGFVASDGSIVGDLDSATESRAAIYFGPSYNSPAILPVPAGVVQSVAQSVNASHQIAGWYAVGSVMHPCVWPSPTSMPVDVPLTESGKIINAGIYDLFNSGSFVGNVINNDFTGETVYMVPKS